MGNAILSTCNKTRLNYCFLLVRIRQMAVQLKDEQGKVQATVLALKTLTCGHCRVPINRGSGPFMAVTDPYYCLVHMRCMPLFEFDGKDRTDPRSAQQEEVRYSDDKVILSKYMGGKSFATRVPPLVREAWRRSFGQLLALVAWRKEVFGEEDVPTEAAAETTSPQSTTTSPPPQPLPPTNQSVSPS